MPIWECLLLSSPMKVLACCFQENVKLQRFIQWWVFSPWCLIYALRFCFSASAYTITFCVSMLRHSWTFWKTFSMVIKLDMCSSNNAHDSIEVITIWITEMKVIHGSNDNSVITANSLTVIARLLQLWQLWDGSHH